MEPPAQSAQALSASQQQQEQQLETQKSHPGNSRIATTEGNVSTDHIGSDSSPLSKSAATTSLLDFSGARFPQLSASTTEILKRMKENPAAMQGWEAAREQVLKRMVTSHNMPTPPLNTSSRGGRGRGRGRSTGSPAARGTIKVETPTSVKLSESTTVTPSSAGRGRGRGRGGGSSASRGSGARRRGAKRKSAPHDSGNDSDGSDISDYTPLPTKTKSGRHIHRPTPFTPALATPTNPNSMRGRRGYKRAPEATVCKICLRGPSPASNMIVFCDGCNASYHQFCHGPPIPAEVVRIPEREWFCITCTAPKEKEKEKNKKRKQEHASEPVVLAKTSSLTSIPANAGHRVSGDGLTAEQKHAYLSALPHAHLVDLLLHAISLHPSLPVFPARTTGPLKSGSAQAAKSNGNNDVSSTPLTLAHDSSLLPSLSSSSSSGLNLLPSSSTTISSAPSYTVSQLADNNKDIDNDVELDLMEPEAEANAANDDVEGDLLDPPYPKAGNGVLLPPESDDIAWLIDDSIGVFSHAWRDGEDGEFQSLSQPNQPPQPPADSLGAIAT
ncbi:hypothetical protein L228DRAFT_285654 [Xylona heveae TC161]|uniref:PHD-type domain-containing protein n=1 Tax=Xylona heveae (strain CBS 132557 / TC161) TaxID=1328760 RepID=A0A164ZYV3_XYLHT|nr:hypothetical protein L228DRAFT_285654 [Xylona heveae TC161]KZF19717.1 hypothetical protein L228DRAFT_285654 [Xylona heveae TC161]